MLLLFLDIFLIPGCIILLIIFKLMEVVASGTTVKGAKSPKQADKSCSRDLSDAQRESIVSAILRDALLVNDSSWDTLVYEGESIYPAADACKCTSDDFELQYGSKQWMKAWVKALSKWFDCQTQYVGAGNFRIYGKEV